MVWLLSLHLARFGQRRFNTLLYTCKPSSSPSRIQFLPVFRLVRRRGESAWMDCLCIYWLYVYIWWPAHRVYICPFSDPRLHPPQRLDCASGTIRERWHLSNPFDRSIAAPTSANVYPEKGTHKRKSTQHTSDRTQRHYISRGNPWIPRWIV
ncbi:hypothetical protein CC80DRAFT_210282 [Byssothecium circinans]|uniref:Uncharacterized protein n=1 Tax=Byssothecium circinans TaxID=147558 RepID=A0A6A5TI87_9PLEO|nr:hypothetical protein CC80DRAFT_210282 [Byssothecium circinans]